MALYNKSFMESVKLISPILDNYENIWWNIVSVEEMSTFDVEIPMCLAIHHNKW